MTPAKEKLVKESLVIAKADGSGEIKLEFSKLRRAVLTLRSLNHPLRKQILVLLEQKKRMTVTEIYDKLKLEQSVASQHLAIMRRAEVVSTHREGKFIFYSVNAKRIGEVTELVELLAQKS